MRVVTITEAIGLDFGEKIPSFKAKVKSVVAQSKGENEHGEWTIQNIVAHDVADQRAEIKLKLLDQPEVPQSWKGKTIYVVSGEDAKKGGICDVTLMQDTYKWKEGTPVKKLIEIRKRAEVSLDQGSTAKEEPPARQTQRPNNQPTASEPASTKGANAGSTRVVDQPAPKKTVEEIRAEDQKRKREAIFNAAKFTARMVNGFRIVFKALDKLVDERSSQNRPLTESQIQGLLAQIFIGGDRKFIWDNLPTTKEELEELWPQKKSQPATESASE
jgi:hypothetical protein